MELRGEPEPVAAILVALADGLALQFLSDPERDRSSTFGAATAAARFLLGA